MLCEWETVGGKLKCRRCHQQLPAAPLPVYAECAGRMLPLGKWIGGALALFGVTPRRWKRLRMAIGLTPSCGCYARQKTWRLKVWR